MTIVIDSSVAVKWFVEEPLREQAAALLDGDQPLLAPDLVMAEVANALWRKARGGETDRFQIMRAILELESILTLRPLDAALTQHAFAIAHEVKHSIYDCIFVACAAREKVPFVTADAKLAAKFSGRTEWAEIRLLAT